MTTRLSRETLIAIGVGVVVLVTMAIEHLIGTEEEPGEDETGLADPPAFAISMILSLGLLVFLFAVFVPRTLRDEPEQAARKALGCALLAIPALGLVFLGVPLSARRRGDRARTARSCRLESRACDDSDRNRRRLTRPRRRRACSGGPHLESQARRGRETTAVVRDCP